MKINIFNICLCKKIKIKKEINQILEDLKVNSNELEINIVGCDELTIQSLNKTYREIDKITDVLSFPMYNLNPKKPICVEDYKTDINPETKLLTLGEIYICKKRAQSQAKDYGHKISREYCFLACHGLLHLLGYDHVDEASEKEMNNIIENALNKLKVTR